MKGREALSELRELLGDAGYASYRPLTEAHREVCMSGSHSWLREEVVNAGAIKSGSNETILDIGNYQKVESLWVSAAASTQYNWQRINETVPSEYELQTADYKEANGTDEVGRPCLFKIEGDRIRWLPTPNDDYDLKIQVVKAPGEVKPGTELLVPGEYSYLVPIFAAAWVLQISADPGEANRGNVLRQRAEAGLSKLTKNTATSRFEHWDRPLKPLVR